MARNNKERCLLHHIRNSLVNWFRNCRNIAASEFPARVNSRLRRNGAQGEVSNQGVTKSQIPIVVGQSRPIWHKGYNRFIVESNLTRLIDQIKHITVVRSHLPVSSGVQERLESARSESARKVHGHSVFLKFSTDFRHKASHSVFTR